MSGLEHEYFASLEAAYRQAVVYPKAERQAQHAHVLRGPRPQRSCLAARGMLSSLLHGVRWVLPGTRPGTGAGDSVRAA